MKGIWKDEEVKSLFSEVESSKAAGKAIREAFNEHAQKYGRKPNSVRNYYYHEIDRLHDDKQRTKRLNINLASHEKSQFSFFTEEEKNRMINKIKEKLDEGYSVRKACLMLSGGDVKEMLRLQNKYRASESSKQSNVLKFKARSTNKITEGDINSLFMGLVKLVKKNALEEAKSQVSAEKIESSATIRKLIMEMGQKDRELKFLRDDYTSLKRENSLLKKKLLLATCYKAHEMSEKNRQA